METSAKASTHTTAMCSPFERRFDNAFTYDFRNGTIQEKCWSARAISQPLIGQTEPVSTDKETLNAG
jgi:hypothetical protein